MKALPQIRNHLRGRFSLSGVKVSSPGGGDLVVTTFDFNRREEIVEATEVLGFQYIGRRSRNGSPLGDVYGSTHNYRHKFLFVPKESES